MMKKKKLFLGTVSSLSGIAVLVGIVNFLYKQNSNRYLDQQRRIYVNDKNPEIERDLARQQIIRYIGDVDSRRNDFLQNVMGNYGKSLSVDEFYSKNKELLW